MLFLIRHRYPRLGAVLSGGLLVVLAEHTHQYRRSLDISERLGNQAGMAGYGGFIWIWIWPVFRDGNEPRAAKPGEP
jgi:hypothetical protein